MPTIIVQIIDDLAFEFILIGRIYNTFWIAAFEVDVDINATLGNSCGLTPVDLTQVITVFIFLNISFFGKNLTFLNIRTS